MMSGSIFNDPTTMGLLGAAQGFAQAAMPSRMPVPLGAAIGMGAGGFAQGQMQGFLGQKAAAEAQAMGMQNQLLQASLPSQLAQYQAMARYYQGLGGGAPFGVPGAGAAGQVGPNWQFSQPEAAMAARLGMLDPTGKHERLMAPALSYLEKFGVQPMPTASGNVEWAPGALQSQYAGSYARGGGEAAGKVGPAIAETAGKSRYEPLQQIDVPDPNNPGGFIKQYVPRGYGAGQEQTGASASQPTAPIANLPAVTNTGYLSLPAKTGTGFNLQSNARIAAQAAGLPPEAQPYWLATLYQESSPWWDNPRGIPDSSKGAIGFGQVMPFWSQKLGGANLRDPMQNLLASAKVFGQGWQQSNGDPRGAMASYYGADDPNYYGPILNRVQRWGGQQLAQNQVGPQQANDASPQAPRPPGVGGMPVLTPQQQQQFELQKVGAQGEQSRLTQSAQQPLQLQRIAAEGEQSRQTQAARVGLTEQEAEEKQYPDRYNEVMKQAQESQYAINRITQAEKAIDAARKGGLGPNALSGPAIETAQYAKALGVNLKNFGIDESALASGQIARDNLVQLNMELLHKLFPQRITNVDVTRVGDKLVNYGMDPAAVGPLMSFAKQQAQYDLAKANDLNAYKAQHGTQRGWQEQFYQKNGYGPPSLFEPGSAALPPEPEKPQAPPQPLLPKAGSNRGPDQGALSIRPTTREEAQALPKGTKFIWTDGKIYERH